MSERCGLGLAGDRRDQSRRAAGAGNRGLAQDARGHRRSPSASGEGRAGTRAPVRCRSRLDGSKLAFPAAAVGGPMARRLRLAVYLGLLAGSFCAAAAAAGPPAASSSFAKHLSPAAPPALIRALPAPHSAIPIPLVPRLLNRQRLAPQFCYAGLRSCLGRLYAPGKLCPVGTASCDNKAHVLPVEAR